MGGHRLRLHPGCRGPVALTAPVGDDRPVPAVRVVPSIPAFSVDGGFWYSLPESMPHVALGWIVRVPLGGRRVRGFVVERAARPARGLKSVAATSGDAPVFDSDLLSTLTWASHHYIAPLAVLLERSAPPNVPVLGRPGEAPRRKGSDLFAGVLASAISGKPVPPLAWIGTVPSPDLAALGADLVAAGGSLVVIAPTSAEAAALAEALGGGVILLPGDADDRSTTRAWAQVAQCGGILVATPRVALWQLKRPAVIVLVEEGRRAMKERQTPTLHVRDVVRARSIREGVPLVAVGPTPSVELIGAGATVRKAPGRAWALVEVVDRRGDPPGAGLLSETTKQALRAVVARGATAFVYAHRRGYAAAVRCVSCRTIRRCPDCGSRPDPGDTCSRCGAGLAGCSNCGGRRFEPLGAGVGRVVEEVRRVVGSAAVRAHPEPAPVTVGTERDLADLGRYDLVVLVDLDGLVYGTHFRAAEEALRIGARLAGRVAPGTGKRLLVQTSAPDHPVVVALRRGDPEPFLRQELEVREAFSFPPSGELIVVETREGSVDGADEELRALDGSVAVLGPAESREGVRWLIQAGSLDRFRRGLRPLVQRWRDAGVTVRIDVDPIDL